MNSSCQLLYKLQQLYGVVIHLLEGRIILIKMAVKIIVCLLLCAVAASASYVPYCTSPQEKSTKQYAIGSRITYSCPKGSVLIGERIATCLLDKTSHQGYWSSPIPTCKSKFTVNCMAFKILCQTFFLQ